MRGIRPFEARDISRVTMLHCDAFGNQRPQSQIVVEEYRHWLTTVFLDSPMRNEALSSIVHEEDGELTGFLGIVPRKLKLEEKVYEATVCSNFCVRPDRRGGIGAQLLTHYRNMPQDVAFVDEVRDRAGALFQRCGWNVSGVQSVRWVLPLRPVERVLSTLQYRLPASLIGAGRPASRGLDVVLQRMPRSPFRLDEPGRRSRALTPQDLARLIEEFGTPRYLRPLTEDGSTEWLVERARGMSQQGELRLAALDDVSGDVAGWYVYYAKAGGQSEVLQLVATRDAAKDVLDSLMFDAYSHGSVSLSGTLHPYFLPHLAARRALFDSASGSRWMLVHTRHEEIMEAFWRCDLLLSRLDGEWFQHLR